MAKVRARATDTTSERIPLADLLVAATHPQLAVRFLDIHFTPGKVSPALRRRALRLRKRLQHLAEAELLGEEE